MPTTVLIVEDEPDLVRVMEMALGRAGLHVVTTGSGYGARALVQQLEIDAVVMDRGLLDMDGLEATALLRADGYQGAVVIVSGYAGTDHVAASYDAGADGVLAKPFRLTELVEQVQQCIAQVAVPEAG